MVWNLYNLILDITYINLFFLFMQQETKVRKSKKADKQAKILLEDKNPHTAIKLPLYLIPADETNGNSKRRISVQDAAAEISNESYNYNKADVTVIEDSEKPKKSKKAKVGKKSKESDDADQSGKCLASKIAIKDVGLDIVDRDDEIKLQTETSKEGEFKIKKKKEKKIKVNEVKIQAIEQEVKKSGISLLLFYAYISPEWTSAQYTEAQTWATETASSFNITGRLRVAKEGFNGTMTGDYDGIRSWCNSIREWNPAFFGNTDFKITDLLPEGQRFPELKVFGVKELVNYGLEGKQPDLIHGGTHLAPKDFHEKMRNDNTLIIDVRNFYEAEIGHFTPPEGGAKYIDPQMRVSTEFPQWVKDNAGELAGKDIMMFCTGGIRCERASALVKEYVEEVGNVFQLQGGIHRYLEEYSEDGGFWKGFNCSDFRT